VPNAEIWNERMTYLESKRKIAKGNGFIFCALEDTLLSFIFHPAQIISLKTFLFLFFLLPNVLTDSLFVAFAGADARASTPQTIAP
jgi:hypothetical protein